MATEKRLIDANALLRRLQKRREDFASGWRTLDSMPDGAKAKYEENLACSLIIEDCPTVDAVEMVHGRWKDMCFGEYYMCSECDFLTDWRLSNYCPNCGAKMRGSEE